MKKTGAFIIGLLVFFPCSFIYAQEDIPATFSLTASVLSPIVKGDKEKVEEDYWLTRRTNGGIEDFDYLKEYRNGDYLQIGGKLNPNNNDYALNIDYGKEGVGSLKFAFKEFRKYFDGTGGFYPLFLPTAASPDIYFETYPDLHLDIGSFKLEGILAREGAPKYTLSYERDSKNGTKSLLMWGTVTGAGAVQKKIYPNYLVMNEVVNKVKLGVEHRIKNVNVSLEQLWENAKAENNNIYSDTYTLSTGALTSVSTQYNNFDHDIFSTVLRCDKTWDKRIFSSLGIMFNHFTGNETEDVVNPGGTANRYANPASIKQNSVVFLPNVSLSPMKDLTMDTGLRFEFIDKDAHSSDNVDTTPGGVVDRFTNHKTRRVDKKFAQNLELKYKRFQNVVFYAEVDLQQRFIDLHEKQESFGTNPTDSFLRITNDNEFDNDVTVGGKWYLLSNLDATTEFKRKYGIRDYKHIFKSEDIITNYPAYITYMEFITYSPVFKLNYKPLRWLSASAGYNYELTTYGIRTLASNALEINSYKANVFSFNVILTPSDGLYLTLFFQKKNAATRTRANGEGGSGSSITIPTYNGDVNVAGATFSYAPDPKNTITGGYSMYKTDNFNNFSGSTQTLALGVSNFSQDISLGIEHKLTKNLSLDFKYTFAKYVESSNSHIDDYKAHLIYSAAKMKF